jgi:hypothetical protein
MRKLVWRTVRIQRGWLDRLKGFDRLYETEIKDGERITHGRGPTREAAEQSARRNWEAKFGQDGRGERGEGSRRPSTIKSRGRGPPAITPKILSPWNLLSVNRV